MNSDPTILVKCERTIEKPIGIIHTDYTGFTAKAHCLEIVYYQAQTFGEITGLVAYEKDTLFYTEYIEAQNVYDGHGWNLTELLAWCAILTHANAIQFLTTIPQEVQS